MMIVASKAMNDTAARVRSRCGGVSQGYANDGTLTHIQDNRDARADGHTSIVCELSAHLPYTWSRRSSGCPRGEVLTPG